MTDVANENTSHPYGEQRREILQFFVKCVVIERFVGAGLNDVCSIIKQ